MIGSDELRCAVTFSITVVPPLLLKAPNSESMTRRIDNYLIFINRRISTERPHIQREDEYSKADKPSTPELPVRAKQNSEYFFAS